jgi:glutamate N-acetyltransferase/amino-acid N-acetyltransferase
MKRAPSAKIITVPGFAFSGISAGIKKTAKKDLALIFSEKPALIAGVFTTNKIKAAPVKLNSQKIRREGKAQALIVNSGNANACTGSQGIKDAQEMARLTARELGLSPGHVYVSSTGLIGRPLPMDKIKKAIPETVKTLSPRRLNHAASAIMTTDTFAKSAFKKISVNGRKGIIAGIAKGAGMICPHMATMLCFLFTDIAVGKKALDSALKSAVKNTFNRLIIDNDMSTNDTVLLISNGLLNNKPITGTSRLYKTFTSALTEITSNLAEQIARDAEGATKLIRVCVRGAKTETDAEKAARAVASSLLVRTAVYGNSPNWGRIIAAIGYSGAEVKEEKISININNVHLAKRGIRTKNKIPKLLLAKDRIQITIDLGLGKREATILTSDLTEKYIKINASYLT